MKKVFGILAVAVLSVGLYSCEEENPMEETQALYEHTNDTFSPTDGEVVKTDDREGVTDGEVVKTDDRD
jgi:hypothetical protein